MSSACGPMYSHYFIGPTHPPLHELMTGQRRVHELGFEELAKVYTINDEPLSMVAEE